MFIDTTTDTLRYGIHGVEMLFTTMGPGCTTVARTSTEDTDVCVGTWNDGRVGTFRGMRNVSAYGGHAYGKSSVNELGGAPGYEIMLVAILEFFRCAKPTSWVAGPYALGARCHIADFARGRTHVPPVAEEETFDIYAFMIAADESKARGGVPVTTKEVMETAKAEAQKVLDNHYGAASSPRV